MSERQPDIMDSGEAQLTLRELFATVKVIAEHPNPRKELLEQLELRILEESEVIEAFGLDVGIEDYFGIDDALNLLAKAHARIDS